MRCDELAKIRGMFCIHLHPIWANVFKMPLRLIDPSHGGKKGSISPTIWKAVLPKKTTYLSQVRKMDGLSFTQIHVLERLIKDLEAALEAPCLLCICAWVIFRERFIMSCRVVHLVWGCLEDIRILRWENSRDDKGPPCILVCAVCHGLKDDFCRNVNEWTPIQSSFASRKPPLYPGLPTRRWSRWSRLGEGGGNGHPDSFKCEFDKIEMRHADVFL